MRSRWRYDSAGSPSGIHLIGDVLLFCCRLIRPISLLVRLPPFRARSLRISRRALTSLCASAPQPPSDAHRHAILQRHGPVKVSALIGLRPITTRWRCSTPGKQRRSRAAVPMGARKNRHALSLLFLKTSSPGQAQSATLKAMEDQAGRLPGILTLLQLDRLQGKTEGWYTQSVFECPAKLGRERSANRVRPSYQPRIACFQIAKERRLEKHFRRQPRFQCS